MTLRRLSTWRGSPPRRGHQLHHRPFRPRRGAPILRQRLRRRTWFAKQRGPVPIRVAPQCFPGTLAKPARGNRIGDGYRKTVSPVVWGAAKSHLPDPIIEIVPRQSHPGGTARVLWHRRLYGRGHKKGTKFKEPRHSPWPLSGARSARPVQPLEPLRPGVQIGVETQVAIREQFGDVKDLPGVVGEMLHHVKNRLQDAHVVNLD